MAEQTQKLEREYIIPLRKEWQKVANYRRTGRAVKAIKKFIARHMKLPNRDVDKVKLDMYLNQEIWFRGKTKPPAKIKVRAIKENDIVRVELVDMPDVWKFAKQKNEKLHKEPQTKSSKKETEKAETKTEEQTDEKKKEESEKEQSVANVRAAEAKLDAKTQKHTSKVKEPQIHRMALKK